MNVVRSKVQTVLRIRKAVRVRIHGMSMAPLIKEGDLVEARTIDREIQVGDIVLLEHEGHLICHRVYEMFADENYRTKGDNNKLPDSIISHRKNILALIDIED